MFLALLAQLAEPTLVGEVVLDSGAPVVNAQVWLRTPDGQQGPVFTSSAGLFLFRYPPSWEDSDGVIQIFTAEYTTREVPVVWGERQKVVLEPRWAPADHFGLGIRVGIDADPRAPVLVTGGLGFSWWPWGRNNQVARWLRGDIQRTPTPFVSGFEIQGGLVLSGETDAPLGGYVAAGTLTEVFGTTVFGLAVGARWPGPELILVGSMGLEFLSF